MAVRSRIRRKSSRRRPPHANPTRRLHLEQLEERRVMYSQAVHVWLTEQGYEFFEKQFGESAITAHEALFTAGAFDEDEAGRNPFGQSALANHPSLRHFWDHDASFARAFDDGLAGFDSAANRAIKYMRGGHGLTGVLDSEWGDGPSRPGQGNAVPGEGAPAVYESALETAVYYLGHAAHLLEDMSVPAHVHADQHLELWGAGVNPDPYHDWVDGAEFSTSVFQNPTHVADFDDATPARWTRWALPADEDSTTIRTAEEILAGFTPGTATVDVGPLFRLFLDTASLADNFDSRNADGQVDDGNRGDTGNPLDTNNYDNWTRAELDEMAAILVPQSIRDVADLIRYFYGVVDSGEEGEALVEITAFDELELDDDQLPEGPDNPRISETAAIELKTAASDKDSGDSGVGKDSFRFEYRVKAPEGSWSDWQAPSSAEDFPGYTAADGLNLNSGHFTTAQGAAQGDSFVDLYGANAAPLFRGQIGYTYGFRVTVEDGAGVESESEERYVKIGKSGVNVIEVIDRSGSMSGSPLAEAKQAAILFLNQMDEGDRIGIVSYSSSASVSFPITQITAGGTAVSQAASAINALFASGSTSIGSGIAAADNQLDTLDAGESRAMIVMTDGQENAAPFALDVINSQVAADIRIYTIGFGSGVDSAALAQIAALRGGSYYFAPDGATLAQIYAELSGVVSGDQVQDRVTGTIQQDETVSRSIEVDPTVSQLTFGVTWPGSDLDLELVRPDGTTVTQATGAPGIEWFEGPTFELVKINVPMLGGWEVRVKGVQVDAGGEPYELFSRIDSTLRADIVSAAAPVNLGDPANVRVQISGSAQPTGLIVKANIVEPGGTAASSALLYDDGAHNDGAAGDGIFGNDLLLGDSVGEHQVQIEASGTVFGGFSFSRTPATTREVVGSGSSGPQTTYSSTDIPKTIADSSTVTSTIAIPDSRTIVDLDVQLDITHTFDSDLDVFLIAPGGQRTELFTDVGGGSPDFDGTILDAQAATSITSGTAPFAGRFRPEGDLQTLVGLSSQGTWTLEITDDAGGDIGTLNNWSLIVAEPAVPPDFSVLDGGELLPAGQMFGLGILQQGDAPVIRQITVRNNGSRPVALSGIQLPAGFELAGSPQGIIPIGASAQFAVQVDTSVVGHHRGASELAAGGQGASVEEFEFTMVGSVVPAGANLWQNFVDANDVDADGDVFPIDALVVINHLRDTDSRELIEAPPTSGLPYFIDVNGDFHLSPIDALIVINWLNRFILPEGEGEGEGEGEESPLFVTMDSAAPAKPAETAVFAFPLQERLGSGHPAAIGSFARPAIREEQVVSQPVQWNWLPRLAANSLPGQDGDQSAADALFADENWWQDDLDLDSLCELFGEAD